MNGPLSGIRVLDAATFIAAPFCGTILAEFGAEVIKIEQPKVGDSLRRFGTPTECDDTLVWLSEARNKDSVTLNLSHPEGSALFRRLVGISHVVLENYRPGTFERWGLGYEQLASINPALVMLRVSAYGQTGPLRNQPGFARIAHAFSGLAYLAGEPDGRPVVPGSTSLADYVSGLFGAIGVLVALRHAERTGEGQAVDVALYESIFRILDELAPAYAKYGFKRERMGPDIVNMVPHSHYKTKDGQWIALACSNDRMWQRLTQAMKLPEYAHDHRYAKAPGRNTNREEVNALVAAWVASLDCSELLAACEAVEVPCSKILDIAEIFAQPQYAARNNLQRITDPRAGELVLPAPVPKMQKTPSKLRSAGPALGSSNDSVFRGLLGLTADDLIRLERAGVI